MPDQSNADVIKRSVTRDNYNDAKRAGVWHFMLPLPADLTTGLPNYWSFQRDFVLRSAPLMEANWADAIFKATTKMSSLTWKLDGKRVGRYQDLLFSADSNQSWVAFLSKQLQDYLGTDNGQFIEVVRATRAAGSRIVGLLHLDSWRCQRTGDPDIPLIYRDRMGALHEMQAHQVLMLSDMPDPSATLFGVGHCAAERAWSKIRLMTGLEAYLSDKITGRRPLAIHIVNGGGELSEVQMQDAIDGAKEQAASQGYKQYMGAVIVTTLDPTATPSVATIPLAELPDGFDATKERKDARLVYANSIGIDPQTLDPDLLASRAMGTGAQSRVIEEKEDSTGLSAWRSAFSHMLNQFVLPDTVTFAFSERDLRDEASAAQVQMTRAQARGQMLTNGEITSIEARQLAVDADDLPKEFMPQAVDTDLTDDEKPDATQISLPDEMPQASDLPPTLQADQLVRSPAPATQSAKALSPALSKLLEAAKGDIRRATDDLKAQSITLDEWYARVKSILLDYHTKAYRTGLRAGTRALTPGEQNLIDLHVKAQLDYLDRFAEDIRGTAGEWNNAFDGRAEMYAQSIGASYWDGRTKGLPLPAMPKDGTTQCLTNCKCKWRIEWLDEETGDADAYWVRDADDSCQTCVQRESDWNPFRIRAGRVAA